MIETFANPPVTEALIDLRVEQSSPFDISTLEKCHDNVKDRYPVKKTRRVWEGKIEFKDGKPPVQTPSRNDIDGYLFWSEDQKQVVQFRVDGFAFSRLKPYTNWEYMYDEAMRLWESYKSNVKPLAITRVAVRYVNLIEIPGQQIELSDYFTAPPKLPDNIPYQIAHFMNRFVINLEDTASRAIVTMTVAPKTNPNTTGIIFDLDVFRENIRLPIGDSTLPQVLGDLRESAYQLFSKSTTEQTKGLFR